MFNFFARKTNTVVVQKTTIINDIDKPKRFFIFANRYQHRYGDLDDFLYSHPDYNEQSVFVLFNLGLPLQWFKSVREFERKWIWFRALSKGYGDYTYRDLQLVNKFNFERFYHYHDHTEHCHTFYDLIKVAQLDISKLHHCSKEYKEHHSFYNSLNNGMKQYRTSKKPSTGLWVYIYLKNKYPNAKFTLIGFNADISPRSHSAKIERQYLLTEIMFNKNLETFKCLE